jgi:hypothetical protein
LALIEGAQSVGGGGERQQFPGLLVNHARRLRCFVSVANPAKPSTASMMFLTPWENKAVNQGRHPMVSIRRADYFFNCLPNAAPARLREKAAARYLLRKARNSAGVPPSRSGNTITM